MFTNLKGALMQIFYIFPQQYRHFESIVRFDFVVHTIYISDPLVYSCSASSTDWKLTFYPSKECWPVFCSISYKHLLFSGFDVCDMIHLVSLCFFCLSSYLHCRWADLEELEKDKRIHQKVKRFKAKQQLNSFITEVSPALSLTITCFLSLHCALR